MSLALDFLNLISKWTSSFKPDNCLHVSWTLLPWCSFSSTSSFCTQTGLYSLPSRSFPSRSLSSILFSLQSSLILLVVINLSFYHKDITPCFLFYQEYVCSVSFIFPLFLFFCAITMCLEHKRWIEEWIHCAILAGIVLILFQFDIVLV